MMTRIRATRIAALPLLAATMVTMSPAQANLIANGDFDNNASSGCDFNLSNPDFTTLMDGATAFGSAAEIDIMEGDCGYGSAPVSGDTKISIHTVAPGGAHDAFSFDLTSSLSAGASYDLAFFAQSVLDFDADAAGVEIGLSTSATEFGSLVFASGAPGTRSWTQFNHTFIAPLAATYLTVRNDLNSQVWNHLDSFSLTGATTKRAVPAPGTLALLALGLFGLGATVRRRP